MTDGFTYGDDIPVRACPYCGTECHADFVDIGVGYQQCGPYHCAACGASQIGPYDEPRELSAAENASGWYAPGEPPGSSANVIGGKIVSHRTARDVYHQAFEGNPLYDLPGYVDEWWRKQRSGG